MPGTFDRDRRRFLGTAATTLAAARVGLLGAPEASASTPRELGVLERAEAWVNGPPVSAAQLLGKVVVIQFGTYTCINWLRTLPYVRAWHQKYTRGLAVVGVHTPEFAFEKDIANVRRAVEGMNIHHPLAIDSDFAIWRAFENQAWPALYFIDARGRVREHHFGEGEYERSERIIQKLLAEAGVKGEDPGFVSITGSGIELPADWETLGSPEVYLGHDRTEGFSSPGGAASGRRRVYTAPARMDLNRWALAGDWTVASHATSLSQAPGSIVYRFHARDVHLVMGPPRGQGPVRFRVRVDGQPAGPAHGLDVAADGTGTADYQRLHQLIRQPGRVVDRTLEIEFLDAGVEAFSFTFG